MKNLTTPVPPKKSLKNNSLALCSLGLIWSEEPDKDGEARYIVQDDKEK